MIALRSVPLGKLATIEREIVEASDIRSGSLYVGLENIESGGRLVGIRPVNTGELASNKFKFTSNHLLYGKLRPYLAKIARPNFDGICSTDIVPVLPRPGLDRGYLAWMLLTPALVAVASSRASGANLPRISAQALAAIEIPITPLSEQRRIAEILDKADALRAKRRAVLAQLDILKQSIFLEMFGEPAALSPQDRIPITELLRIQTGRLDSNAAEIDGCYPFFTCDRETLRINTYAFDCEALLLAGNNATGDYSVKHYHGKFNAYQRTYVMTLKDPRGSYEYVRHALQHKLSDLKRGSKGTNTKYLTMELFSRTFVQFPPKDRQEEFARRVRTVESLEAVYGTSLDELDALFSCLQHRAFRGEL